MLFTICRPTQLLVYCLECRMLLPQFLLNPIPFLLGGDTPVVAVRDIELALGFGKAMAAIQLNGFSQRKFNAVRFYSHGMVSVKSSMSTDSSSCTPSAEGKQRAKA